MNETFDFNLLRTDQTLLLDALRESGAAIKNPDKEFACPFCDDKRPSAGLYEREGQWRFKCHKCDFVGDGIDVRAKAQGSTRGQIIAAMHDTPPRPRPTKVHSNNTTPKLYRTVEDLIRVIEFSEREKGGKVTEHYEYDHPTTGKVELIVFRLMRADGSKSFRQASSVEGGFVLKAPDGKLPIYNRNEIATAKVVIVVEGEKDVHTLRKAGHVATTSPGGAKAASKADWTPLQGKRVVVWPDHDEAGQGYANDVLGILHGLGCGVSIVDPASLGLKAKQDVSDYLDGYPMEEWNRKVCYVVDNYSKKISPESKATAPTGPQDPGLIPDRLLHVPGFVAEVMNYSLQTAPYPNRAMAFCGALAMQAYLCGRKVRDPMDNRTNIYLLGLANSGAGKDYPRKVNNQIAEQAGMIEGIKNSIASGEGIEDALYELKNILCQTDEIDGMLRSINKSKEARHEKALNILLQMYSSANNCYKMRMKAYNKDNEPRLHIDQPCLSIFGTAIPKHYYEAFNTRMLSNGFFARMIVVESGPRADGQEAAKTPLPDCIIDKAKHWAKYEPESDAVGDIARIFITTPTTIEWTAEAKRILTEGRVNADAEYRKHELANDDVGMSIWARCRENICKLALIYACSNNHLSPSIDAHAVQWATEFAMHQTRRMLFMASAHVAESPFQADCNRLIEKLRGMPGRSANHSLLLKRMRTDAKGFGLLIDTLHQSGDIAIYAEGNRKIYELVCD